MYGGSVVLSGELSSATAGQTVEVLATPTHRSSRPRRAVASTTTTAGGEFRVAVRPTVGTIYRVRWKHGDERPRHDRREPARRPRHRLAAPRRVHREGDRRSARTQGASSGSSGAGQFGQWVSLKRVRLTSSAAPRFQARLPKGVSRVRVYMTPTQAGRATSPGSARRGSSAASGVSERRDGRGALCSPAVSFSRERSSMSTLAFQFEEITARELKPALLELDGISRAAVEAHYKLYQGYVNKRNEILGKLAGGRPRRREPGLLGDPRAQGRALVRDRRDQEPRDLLRAPRRRGRRPGRAGRPADQARLRLGRDLARRPQGDRHGRARLGVDRVRLGRGPALQLHRRRAEHVPDLERDAARRARRLRARLLPRLPDRPRPRTSTRSSTTSTGTTVDDWASRYQIPK